MKKAQILLIIIVIAIAGYLATVGNRRDSVAKNEKTPIRIGTILMLSGIGADYGESSQRGIDLAVKEINSKGGVLGRKVAVTHEDNKGDSPKDAVSAFLKLQSKGIKLIVGPNWTPSGLALAPMITDTNAILISPSLGSEKFAEAHKNIFNIWPPDKNGTYALAEFMYKKGHRKVAILGSTQVWESDQAHFFKDKFESLGGTVTAFELPNVDNKDLQTEVIKIARSEPDAVLLTNYGQMSVAAKRLRVIGSKSPLYAVLMDETTVDQADGALEGVEFVTFYSPTQEFKEKYRKEYGKDARVSADTAYDAVYVIKKAIENAGTSDVEEVQKELSKMQKWSGASGDFKFDEQGGVIKNPYFYKVKDGDIVKLGV